MKKTPSKPDIINPEQKIVDNLSQDAINQMNLMMQATTIDAITAYAIVTEDAKDKLDPDRLFENLMAKITKALPEI